MKVKILQGQSLFDIAIQYTGVAYTAVDLAFVNKVALEEPLLAGSFLEVPESLIVRKQTVDYFSAKGIIPATDILNETDVDSDRVFGKEFPKQFS